MDRGGRYFERGATYFWQVADGGGALYFGAKHFEKSSQTHVSTRFEQK